MSSPLRLGHHHALRRGRRSEPRRIYLVTATTSCRVPLFVDFANACAACRAFSQVAAHADSQLLAWVLMPDHVHWLLRLGEEPLGRAVARMKSAVTRDLCGSGDTPRRIWSPAFHDRAIRREEDLRAAARYVVANPLRAGLCDALAEYPFWDAVWLGEKHGEAGIRGKAPSRASALLHGAVRLFLSVSFARERTTALRPM